MLGLEVIDDGVESCRGRYEGLGLLRVITRFSRYEKVTEQVTRSASPSGPILSAVGTVRGYEIHMGETERKGDDEAFCGEGAVAADGMVIGTYLHGLFVNPSARNALLSYLYARKGLKFIPPFPERGDDPYDYLAGEFEQHVRLDPILALFSR
jgi:adenosylcobyric acid synthase